MRLSLPSSIVRLSLIVFVFALSAASARAEVDEEPAGYRAAVDEALVELRAEHFAEARSLFAEAHQLYPNARTLRGLGITAFELRSYVDAVDYLEQALESEVRPLDARLRTETEALLERTHRFVARLHLMLVPAETRVTLDGQPVPLKAGKPLVLEVGEHLLAFTADGFVSEERMIVVKGREVETWEVTLRPVTIAPLAPPSPAAAAATLEHESGPRRAADRGERQPGKPLYKNPWLWTGIGTTAVVAAAVIVGVLATRESDPRARPAVETPNTPEGGILSTLVAAP